MQFSKKSPDLVIKGAIAYLVYILTVPKFVQKWSASGAAESSDPQSFTNHLREVRGVVTPEQDLGAGDVLVLYGANKDLREFLKQRL